MPKVSIILPNYNYSYFIPDAIASIKAQTLQDFECIIIDDASTDSSVNIIKKLIKKDPRFKLIALTETKGISHARNVGLDNATGEYIAFLDSDDCYTQYALEKLVDVAQRANVDVAGGIEKVVSGDFTWQRQEDDGNNDFHIETDLEKVLFKKSDSKWIWIWRRVYKRSFLQNVRFREEMKICGDDTTFVLDFGYKLKKFAETDIVVVLHRSHPGSVSTPRNEINREKISAFPLMIKHVTEDLIDKYDESFLKKAYIDLFVCVCKECLFRKGLSPEDKLFVQKIMKDSCMLIPLKYLPFKLKLLCRFISCQ